MAQKLSWLVLTEVIVTVVPGIPPSLLLEIAFHFALIRRVLVEKWADAGARKNSLALGS